MIKLLKVPLCICYFFWYARFTFPEMEWLSSCAIAEKKENIKEQDGSEVSEFSLGIGRIDRGIMRYRNDISVNEETKSEADSNNADFPDLPSTKRRFS